MKKIRLLTLFVSVAFLSIFVVSSSNAQDKLTSFYKIGTISGDIPSAVTKVTTALTDKGFEVIGKYSPEKKDKLFVLAFTRKDLQDLTLKKKDRGLLASVLKIGFYKVQTGVEISMVNPIYLFNAYLMDEIEPNEAKYIAIDSEIKQTLKSINNSFVSFGGTLSKDELREYHYMFGMPYFTDPVTLKEFSSFDEGLSIIRNNLKQKKGNTVKVFELVRKDKKSAVFGIGLLDSENGEPFFLPLIGEKHVAALPYELILQGNKATMLNGRYRIALNWPELTMGTFTQIMSTPGDIEETFIKLME